MILTLTLTHSLTHNHTYKHTTHRQTLTIVECEHGHKHFRSIHTNIHFKGYQQGGRIQDDIYNTVKTICFSHGISFCEFLIAC